MTFNLNKFKAAREKHTKLRNKYFQERVKLQQQIDEFLALRAEMRTANTEAESMLNSISSEHRDTYNYVGRDHLNTEIVKVKYEITEVDCLKARV